MYGFTFPLYRRRGSRSRRGPKNECLHGFGGGGGAREPRPASRPGSADRVSSARRKPQERDVYTTPSVT
eukprot:265611-Prymnesium_polylepis.2